MQYSAFPQFKKNVRYKTAMERAGFDVFRPELKPKTAPSSPSLTYNQSNSGSVPHLSHTDPFTKRPHAASVGRMVSSSDVDVSAGSYKKGGQAGKPQQDKLEDRNSNESLPDMSTRTTSMDEVYDFERKPARGGSPLTKTVEWNADDEPIIQERAMVDEPPMNESASVDTTPIQSLKSRDVYSDSNDPYGEKTIDNVYSNPPPKAKPYNKVTDALDVSKAAVQPLSNGNIDTLPLKLGQKVNIGMGISSNPGNMVAHGNSMNHSTAPVSSRNNMPWKPNNRADVRQQGYEPVGEYANQLNRSQDELNFTKNGSELESRAQSRDDLLSWKDATSQPTSKAQSRDDLLSWKDPHSQPASRAQSRDDLLDKQPKEEIGLGWKEPQQHVSLGSKDPEKDVSLGWKEPEEDVSLGWKEPQEDVSLGWKEPQEDVSLGWKEPQEEDVPLGWKEPEKDVTLGWKEPQEEDVPLGWKEPEDVTFQNESPNKPRVAANALAGFSINAPNMSNPQTANGSKRSSWNTGGGNNYSPEYDPSSSSTMMTTSSQVEDLIARLNTATLSKEKDATTLLPSGGSIKYKKSSAYMSGFPGFQLPNLEEDKMLSTSNAPAKPNLTPLTIPKITIDHDLDTPSFLHQHDKHVEQLMREQTTDQGTIKTAQNTTPKLAEEVKYPPGQGPCRKCHKEITTKRIYSKHTGELSGQWHRECFSCVACELQFNKKISCYILDDQPYCQQHYHEANNSICGVCTQFIEGECLENDNHERFHVWCLNCFKCGRLIKEDYFLYNNEMPICADHDLQEFMGQDMNKVQKRRTRLNFV